MSSDESTTSDDWRPRDLPRTVLRPLLSSSGADTNCCSQTTPSIDNDDSSIDNSSRDGDNNLDEDPFLARATKTRQHQRDFSRTIRLSTSGSADHGNGMMSTITRAYTQFAEGINIKTIHVMVFIVVVSLVMKIVSLAPSPIHADVASSMGTIGHDDGLRGAVMLMLDEGELLQGDERNSEQALQQMRYYIAQQQPGGQSSQQAYLLGAQPNSGYAVGHLSTYNQSPVELHQQQQLGQMTQQVAEQQAQSRPAIDPYQSSTQQQLAVPLESVIEDIAITADKKVTADEIITTLQTNDAGENDIPTVDASTPEVPESAPSSQRLGLLNRGYSLLAPSGSED